MKPRSKKPGNKNLIGIQILAYRFKNGIKQKDFLEQLQVFELDISPTSPSKIERQERLVKDHEIIIIAKAMKIDPNELFDWENNKNH